MILKSAWDQIHGLGVFDDPNTMSPFPTVCRLLILAAFRQTCKRAPGNFTDFTGDCRKIRFFDRTRCAKVPAKKRFDKPPSMGAFS